MRTRTSGSEQIKFKIFCSSIPAAGSSFYNSFKISSNCSFEVFKEFINKQWILKKNESGIKWNKIFFNNQTSISLFRYCTRPHTPHIIFLVLLLAQLGLDMLVSAALVLSYYGLVLVRSEFHNHPSFYIFIDLPPQ